MRGWSCQTPRVVPSIPPELEAGLPDGLVLRTVERLADAGAVFALVHGSRARGTHRPDSDLDVAAWFGGTHTGVRAPYGFEIGLHERVDLLALDRGPLEMNGRIALEGVLVLDTDPAQRVRWVATTRKIWFDERPRYDRGHQEFLAAVASRGR